MKKITMQDVENLSAALRTIEKLMENTNENGYLEYTYGVQSQMDRNRLERLYNTTLVTAGIAYNFASSNED